MFNANGTAHAQGAPLPRRLGIFFWGGGVKHDRWNPATTGPTWTPSPALAPLAPLKDYVSVVSGMRVRTGNEQGHHAGAVGILSGAPMVVAAGGQRAFPVDVQRAQHRPGRGGRDRQGLEVQVARGGHLAAHQRGRRNVR